MTRAARGAPARAVVVAAAAAAVVAATAGCNPGPIEVARLPGDSLERSLVAHWSFDEGTGAVLADESGNRRDGAVTGGTWTAGRFAGGMHFVPGSQVAVPAFPDATASWSVSAWVYLTAAEIGIDYVTLVSTEIPFKGGWEMNIDFTTAQPRYHFGYWVGPTQSDYDYAECNCFVPDRWVHLTATVDGVARTLTFYVDGARVHGVTTRANILQGSPILYMGRWSTLDPPRLLTGSLDDVAIWSRALVPEEVARLAAEPAPRQP